MKLNAEAGVDVRADPIRPVILEGRAVEYQQFDEESSSRPGKCHRWWETLLAAGGRSGGGGGASPSFSMLFPSFLRVSKGFSTGTEDMIERVF